MAWMWVPDDAELLCLERWQRWALHYLQRLHRPRQKLLLMVLAAHFDENGRAQISFETLRKRLGAPPFRPPARLMPI